MRGLEQVSGPNEPEEIIDEWPQALAERLVRSGLDPDQIASIASGQASNEAGIASLILRIGGSRDLIATALKQSDLTVDAVLQAARQLVPNRVDDSGKASTLDIIEEIIGCQLDMAEARQLAEAPDDQLGYFLGRFAPFWYDWLERRAIQGEALAGKPIYLASGVGPDAKPGMSLADYKRVALCFQEIAVPDPLAGPLHSTVEFASQTGEFLIEKTQHAFRRGLLRLAEIAPLVRSGAFVLVPDAFCGMHPLVQELAREEVSRAPPEEAEFPARFDRDAFALAMALGARTEAWPVATRTGVMERIERGIAGAISIAPALDVEIAKAMAKFGLPDSSRIPIELLTKVREDEPRFAEFREKLSVSMAKASQLAEDNPGLFATYLRNELDAAAARCRDAVRMSSVLDGAISPAVATLSLAAASFRLGDTFDPTNPIEIAKLLAGISLPGIAWLGVQVTKRFTSPDVRRKRRLAELYGCLLQGPEIENDEAD